MSILRDQFIAAMVVRIATAAPRDEAKGNAAKAGEFVVYYRIRSDGYFLYGEGDDPRGYGGTKRIAEAATFTTAQKARELGEAYLRASRSNPEHSEIVVLKQA
jgi:hypothetical protein